MASLLRCGFLWSAPAFPSLAVFRCSLLCEQDGNEVRCRSASANAQTKLTDTFAGKVVRIIVGYPYCSGFDTYARAVSRHLGSHLPGRPTVVVQNMPGAGRLTSVAYMAPIAQPNGRTIALINPVNSTAALPTPEVSKFDSTKSGWIGSVNKDAQTFVFWTEKVSSRKDLGGK
jgi:tripartite-type tricarboxylate transporter receptor subunit TctC